MAQRTDRANVAFSQSTRLCVALSILLFLAAPCKAFAEPAPGDSCAGKAAGTRTDAGGPEVAGSGYMLVCDGATWKSVLDYTVSSGQVNINIGNDTASCTAAKTGRLRYNSSTDAWEYCDGSDPWLPFEQAGSAGLSGPADCPNIGDQCDDDTIYAGYHPTLHEMLFLHPNNQSAGTQWSNLLPANMPDTGADDIADGKVNQDWVVANTTITDYPAFKLCDDLNQASALGHTDWYLPSRVEIYYLWSVQNAINTGPGDAFMASEYWQSTEYTVSPTTHNRAWNQYFSHGMQHFNLKNSPYDVRCIRRS